VYLFVDGMFWSHVIWQLCWKQNPLAVTYSTKAQHVGHSRPSTIINHKRL